MAKILLINPSYLRTYGSSHVGFANPVYPVLGLAALGGAARQKGHDVTILDLSYRAYNPIELSKTIRDMSPDVVGVTATTPLANQMKDISFLVKEISPQIMTIGGGAHASALPIETMQESVLDVVISGEGDRNFVDIVDGKDPAHIPGIYWRRGERICHNPPGALVEYLDDLPMPAWDLYPINEYKRKFTKILVRNPPLSTIEFSRGCVFKCDFCASKNTMGLGYRKKSPERCADELEYLEKLGYREALLTDDIFTSNNDWALEVCEAIIRRKLKIVWTCTNGIRVDSANEELFNAMVRAGCYRVHFGFESGNEEVLKAFGKGGRATLPQGITAVSKARAAGLDTWGMYMVGLSSDTEASMQDTINYAKKTKVDVMKFGITVPFPGTPMFTELHKSSRIKTYDWDEYNVYNEASALFDHPRLSWDTIMKYYRKAYTQLYYLNLDYILRRVWRGLRTGEFFYDVYYAIRFRFFLAAAPEETKTEEYGYRDRWEPLSTKPDVTPTYKVIEAKTNSYRRPVLQASV